jgi:hypothetical protein
MLFYQHIHRGLNPYNYPNLYIVPINNITSCMRTKGNTEPLSATTPRQPTPHHGGRGQERDGHGATASVRVTLPRLGRAFTHILYKSVHLRR